MGVLVEDGSPESMKSALQRLNELRSDPDLAQRCRRAAEEVFSLEAGTQAYKEIYQDILK